MKGRWLCCLLLTFASVRADGPHAIHGGIDAATVEMTAKFGPHGDPLNYDASLVIDVGTRCSATMIGPRVLLTAAHCVSGGDRAYFTVNGEHYAASCEPAASFRASTGTADWALCLVDGPRAVSGITYDTISLTADRLWIGRPIILTGFGLTETRESREVPKLSIGAAAIKTLPAHESESDELETLGGATLDDGDSGGGAYAIDRDGRRYLVAVNSRRSDGLTSRLASLSSPRARAFIAAWRTRHSDARICGVDTSLTHCRN